MELSTVGDAYGLARDHGHAHGLVMLGTGDAALGAPCRPDAISKQLRNGIPVVSAHQPRDIDPLAAAGHRAPATLHRGLHQLPWAAAGAGW
jgi:hypothetical protein